MIPCNVAVFPVLVFTYVALNITASRLVATLLLSPHLVLKLLREYYVETLGNKLKHEVNKLYIHIHNKYISTSKTSKGELKCITFHHTGVLWCHFAVLLSAIICSQVDCFQTVTVSLA